MVLCGGPAGDASERLASPQGGFGRSERYRRENGERLVRQAQLTWIYCLSLPARLAASSFVFFRRNYTAWNSGLCVWPGPLAFPLAPPTPPACVPLSIDKANAAWIRPGPSEETVSTAGSTLCCLSAVFDEMYVETPAEAPDCSDMSKRKWCSPGIEKEKHHGDKVRAGRPHTESPRSLGLNTKSYRLFPMQLRSSDSTERLPRICHRQISLGKKLGLLKPPAIFERPTFLPNNGLGQVSLSLAPSCARHGSQIQLQSPSLPCPSLALFAHPSTAGNSSRRHHPAPHSRARRHPR